MANNTGQKYGRRKKGTPNRLTKELRLILKDVVYNELQNIDEVMNHLEPIERLELLIKLIPYVLPKIQSTSHTINEPMDWGMD